jgi:hypothetical protein
LRIHALAPFFFRRARFISRRTSAWVRDLRFNKAAATILISEKSLLTSAAARPVNSA